MEGGESKYMRQKKIRGFNRRMKAIDKWRDENLSPDIPALENRGYCYAKIQVSPWNNIAVANGAIPSPQGKCRHRIMQALLDIYDSWKKKMDESGKPYYLRIWLYDQPFSRSQVVCVTGNKKDYYERIFKPAGSKKTPGKNAGERMSLYNWQAVTDDDPVKSTDLWLGEKLQGTQSN